MADILNSPQAEKLLKNKSAVEELVRSPDAQKLMELLNRSAGGGLQSAAEAAMKGNPGRLVGLVNQLMKDPEGAKAVDRLNKTAQK